MKPTTRPMKIPSVSISYTLRQGVMKGGLTGCKELVLLEKTAVRKRDVLPLLHLMRAQVSFQVCV